MVATEEAKVASNGIPFYRLQLARMQSIHDLTDGCWDLVILGAGVAGSSAAILASKQGLKTLLVESKPFPREKVCGGCLNWRAQASLHRLGVKQQLEMAGAVSIRSMRLQILGTQARWPVPTMMSVRRSTLDTILVAKAIECGAEFIDGTQGSLLAQTRGCDASYRCIRLQQNGESATIESRVVLVASGLTRSAIRQEDNWPAKVETNSRIGVQCMIRDADAPAFADGELHMMVGTHGYVGICKTDGGCLDVAAAVDPSCILRLGGIQQVVHGIIAECGHGPIQLPDKEQWLATPSLTRSSSRVADHRVFLIGDSIGYVEPFTGEGMSWALASAESVMQIIAEISSQGWRDDMSDRWNQWASRRSHQLRTCRWIAGQIRWPRGAAWVLRACNWLPPLRDSLIRKTSQ